MEELWKAQEVAEVLKCSPRTVLAMAERGELPSVKISRLRRFRPADIEAWVQDRERPLAAAGR